MTKTKAKEPPTLRDLAAAVFKERSKLYSDREPENGGECDNFERGLTSIGVLWTEMLRSHFRNPDLPVIPPHIAGLMMVATKLERACRSGKHEPDHYVDILNYTEKAYELERKYHDSRPEGQDAPT
jgi:hypothetical protein